VQISTIWQDLIVWTVLPIASHARQVNYCKIGTTCTSCVLTQYLQKGTCVSACSEGYYTSGTHCYKCPSNCLTCSSFSKCLTCPLEYLLLNNNCIVSCPTGKFSNVVSNQYVCSSCGTNCATCTVFSTNCLTCNSKYYISLNKCYACSSLCETCNGTESNNCLSCSDGYYLSGGSCLACSTSCLTCSGSNLLFNINYLTFII